MRTRLILLVLFAYMIAVVGCTSKPADNSANNNQSTSDSSNPASGSSPSSNTAMTAMKAVPKEEKKLVIPTGTAVVVSLGSSLGSKLSQPGQTFTGTVAKDVQVDGATAIAQGAAVSGTVTDAKPLGKFAGGAVLGIKIDSIHIGSSDVPVTANAREFSAKGKGKRTAVLAGGGAALGGIIGGIAGGGKGAAIGLLAGGGAGGAGAAFTGNKDIVLPAESTVSFELTQSIEVKQ